MKRIATVKNIRLDRTTREIIITIDAKSSIYVEEPKGIGFPQFMNSDAIVEGLNIILEHGSTAVNALKKNEDFSALRQENNNLKSIINTISAFENGQRVSMTNRGNKLTYQKEINQHTFYTDIANQLDKI